MGKKELALACAGLIGIGGIIWTAKGSPQASRPDAVEVGVRYPLVGQLHSFKPETVVDEAMQADRIYDLTGSVDSEPDETGEFADPDQAGRIGIDIPDRAPPTGPGMPEDTGPEETPQEVVAEEVVEDTAEDEIQQITVTKGEPKPTVVTRVKSFANKLEPVLTTSIRTWRLKGETDEQEEVSIILAPSFRYLLEGRKSTLDSRYYMEIGRRWGDFSDDIRQHRLDSLYKLNVFGRSEVKLRGRLLRTEDLEEKIAGDFSLFHLDMADLEFSFNRGQGKDRFRFGVTANRILYDYDGSFDIERYSHDRSRLVGDGYYQFRPRVAFRLGTQYSDFDYDDQTLSSRQIRLLVGGEIEFSSRLSASIALGRERKNFDQGPSSSQNHWAATLLWQPRRNTRLRFDTSQSYIESYRISTNVVGGEDTVDRSFGFQWIQQWAPRLESILGIRQNKYGFVDNTLIRNDWSMLVNYRMRQWVTLSAFASTINQDRSTVADAEFSSIEFTAEVRF